jgi:hypothetical protein
MFDIGFAPLMGAEIAGATSKQGVACVALSIPHSMADMDELFPSFSGRF